MGETPVHPNTLRFAAYDSNDEEVLVQRWCSIGGGFIALEDRVGDPALDDDRNLPFPFRSARELLTLCERNGLSIAELVRANELANVSEDELQRHLDSIRSEEHTSELQSLMRISYAVFCLKK